MTQLHQSSLSLDHQTLIKVLAEQDNLLIIQDLDGVCMNLVKDPITRQIDSQYLTATKAFKNHFFVLTNGEHIGKRGVRGIVERAFDSPEIVKERGLYLPGLAGGGVQWQDSYGNVSHPGVSDRELDFLETIPQKIEVSLKEFFQHHDCGFTTEELNTYIKATVLDNKVSPTINLNVFHDVLSDNNVYVALQQAMASLTEDFLKEAEKIGLNNSFFVHFAPNLGRDEKGLEIMQVASEHDSGTTDLQFMLRGAIKEAGVLFILNHYYYLKTGNYPLGKDFNSRKAPHQQTELLALVKDNFDPKFMPLTIGIGDTVTSQGKQNGSEIVFKRGGSDRLFLELIQAIGREFNTENLVVYVDSSAGELKNRKALTLNSEKTAVIESIGDPRDTNDPLTLNVVFPGGYQQYTQVFQEAANQRANSK